MGETAARTDESLAAIRATLELLQTQLGSFDARMGLLDNASQQVTAQLDMNSRAIADHTRVMDGIERRQEALAQQMAATAELVARLAGPKGPSLVFEVEDGNGDTERINNHNKGIIHPTSGSAGRNTTTGGGFPGSTSAFRPHDPGRAASRGTAGEMDPGEGVGCGETMRTRGATT
jgi:hypothetical protein